MKAKFDKVLKFSYSKLNPKRKQTSNVHARDICMTTRTSNVRLLYVIFTSDVCRHSCLITPYHLQSNFGMGVFLYIPPIFWQQLLLEHLRAMAPIISIDMDSIVTTRNCFKDCILACKTEIKCIQSSRK